MQLICFQFYGHYWNRTVCAVNKMLRMFVKITFDLFIVFTLLIVKYRNSFTTIWCIKSNLHYTRGITPKRVTSSGAHLRDLAPGQHSSEKTSQRWETLATLPIWSAWESNSRLTTLIARLATELTYLIRTSFAFYLIHYLLKRRKVGWKNHN